MAWVIPLPLSTRERRAPVAHVWPAQVIAIESRYFDAARTLRSMANTAMVRGEKERAHGLRSRSRQLDAVGMAIQQKADALARARAREMAAQIIELTNKEAG